MIAQPSFDLNFVHLLIEVLATLACALSGLLEAARKKLDAVGVVVVAGLAAFGGGTLRDILLDRRPFSGCNMPRGYGGFWSFVWWPFCFCVPAILK